MSTKSCETVNGFEERTFNTGTAHLGDCLLRAFAFKEVPQENYNEELRKVVSPNETVIELLADIRAHKCSSPKIVRDDIQGKCIIGFKCNGCLTKWKVPLWELKDCAVHHPEIMDIFRTNESRDELASNLTKELNESR